jgi:hypothetical protein
MWPISFGGGGLRSVPTCRSRSVLTEVPQTHRRSRRGPQSTPRRSHYLDAGRRGQVTDGALENGVAPRSQATTSGLLPEAAAGGGGVTPSPPTHSVRRTTRFRNRYRSLAASSRPAATRATDRCWRRETCRRYARVSQSRRALGLGRPSALKRRWRVRCESPRARAMAATLGRRPDARTPNARWPNR